MCLLAKSCFIGTFSIAYGVVSDIAHPAERGYFVGIVAFGYVILIPLLYFRPDLFFKVPMLHQALAPCWVACLPPTRVGDGSFGF